MRRRQVLGSGLCLFMPGLSTAAQSLRSDPEKTLIVCYSFSGTSYRVARLLAAASGADLYRIQTAEPYKPGDAREHRAKGILPEIAGPLPDMARFNRIVLVFPIWGYTVSLPMQRFLQKADLAGKTVDAVAVGIGRHGALFERLDGMLRGARLHASVWIRHASDLNDGEIRERLSSWNTGRVPVRVVLTKGIEAKGAGEVSADIDNAAFARTLPRTAKWTSDPAKKDTVLRPTDPTPGYVAADAAGNLFYNGVRVGWLRTPLPEGTFEEEEGMTLF